MNNGEMGKFLKPTQAASYNARANRVYPILIPSLPSPTGRLWRRLCASVWVFTADHLVANLALGMTFARVLAPARIFPASGTEAISSAVRFAFNWAAALIILLLMLPLFFVIALAIKLDSSGSVFFVQERIGRNRRRRQRRCGDSIVLKDGRRGDRRKQNQYGRPFSVYKFRTMVADAEKRCGPIWATRNDPRVTKVGRFLRKTRLDELPQLLNVLRGEMALVGPRPERPFFIDKLARQIEGYAARLEVRPGITGLAQVENGYDTSVDDVRTKVAYDLSYIKSSSIRRDIVIILKTIGVVLGCRGL